MIAGPSKKVPFFGVLCMCECLYKSGVFRVSVSYVYCACIAFRSVSKALIMMMIYRRESLCSHV
jgi:hypothetical protein